MATLYIVNHAESLESCLGVARTGDVVLLIQGAASAAAYDHPRPVIALQDDLLAQGVTELGANVTSTDYPGFVELAVAHQPIVSWR